MEYDQGNNILIQITICCFNSEINDIILIDNDQLASAGWDHKIIIWNTYTGKIFQTLNDHSGELNTLKAIKLMNKM